MDQILLEIAEVDLEIEKLKDKRVQLQTDLRDAKSDAAKEILDITANDMWVRVHDTGFIEVGRGEYTLAKYWKRNKNVLERVYKDDAELPCLDHVDTHWVELCKLMPLGKRIKRDDL